MSIMLVLLFLYLLTVKINFCHGTFSEGCLESERQALLLFKQDLIDHTNRLASWISGEDCCRWDGVTCDNVTGHVVGLQLKIGNLHRDAELEVKLRGKINPSLLELKHLSYLDLSNNAFGGIPIPEFLGSIESLKRLSLSSAGFGGLVPHQLGNLSSLRYLNLHANNEYNLSVANLQWLSGLSLLEHLDLRNVNLSKASNWLQELNTLPSLEKLHLSGCQLSPVIPPSTNLNLSSLAILDLSDNSFEIPLMEFSWIFHLNNLVSLDLSHNDLEGHIFDGPQNMTSLKHLDLSFNSINSSIPDWLYNLSSLQFLNLGSNHLHGGISSAIGNMSSIIDLDFSDNELKGRIPRSMGNLCNLQSITLSQVNLGQDVSDILEVLSGCVSKQLVRLDLSESQIFGQLTPQLGKFKNLSELFLSGNSISGSIPFSIGDLSALRMLKLDRNKLKGGLPNSFGKLVNLQVFNISDNLLKGVVSETHFTSLTNLKILHASRNFFSLEVCSDWIPPFKLRELELRSLNLGSKFPLWLCTQKHLKYVDISNSGISDSIPNCFGSSPFQFQYFNLSHNQIQGQMPNITSTVFDQIIFDLSCNRFTGPLPRISSNVSFLDLSNNLLSGSLDNLLCLHSNETMGMEFLSLGGNCLSREIPDCWMNWQHLMAIRLDNNSLTGSIPSTVGTLDFLLSLQLQKNSLHGEIPSSLKNCSELVLLDFGENGLNGKIPGWLGHSLSKLIILRLRSNKFSGYIPDQLCAVSSIQVLDLADNNLHGNIPSCIGNFTAMVEKNGAKDNKDIPYVSYSGSLFALLVMKGQMLEYTTTLNLVRSLDFSDNNLSGEIPMEVTGLFELQSLNLSHNVLTGNIPTRIGEMISLESVDFSVNKLSGSIPHSFSNLNFLNHLNLSYNNLTGEIPSSTQLQSFDISSYVGNQLCGLPLATCPTNHVGNGDGEKGKGFETDWFYLGMASGFVIGFWSVFGPLVFDKRWRSLYTLSSVNLKPGLFGQLFNKTRQN